jgi:hypothetical protein
MPSEDVPATPGWASYAEWLRDAETRDRHDDEKEKRFWEDTLVALKAFFKDPS